MSVQSKLLHLFGGPRRCAEAAAVPPSLSSLLHNARAQMSGKRASATAFVEQLFRCPFAGDSGGNETDANHVASQSHALSYADAFRYADAIALNVEKLLSTKAAANGPSSPSQSKALKGSSVRAIAILELRVPFHIILCELGLLANRIPFCPMNPDDSEQRRHALREALLFPQGGEDASQISLIVVNDALVQKWIVEADTPQTTNEPTIEASTEADEDAVAYFIFTSGTTGGAPKAVKVLRKQIALYGKCYGRRFIESEHSNDSAAEKVPVRVLYASAITFDPSIGDIVIAITYLGTIVCSGGTLLRPHPTLRDAPLSSLAGEVDWAYTANIVADMSFLVAHSAFTHLTSTPVVLGSVSDAVREGLRPLKRGCSRPPPTVCLGGEPMQPSLAAKWADTVTLYNTYGVTEAVIYQNATLMGGGDGGTADFAAKARTLGAPLDATACWCAIDFEGFEAEGDSGEGGQNSGCENAPSSSSTRKRLGELILLGPMLAEGYQRPSNAFFTHTFVVEDAATNQSETVSCPAYRTGDVVSYLEEAGKGEGNGVCTFVGRKDFQVKINGKRTSLEEVEALIKAVVVKGRAFQAPRAAATDVNDKHNAKGSYFAQEDPWLALEGKGDAKQEDEKQDDEIVGQKRTLRGGENTPPKDCNDGNGGCQYASLLIKGCTVSAVNRADLMDAPSSPPSSAMAPPAMGASDEKVLICYLCIEAPLKPSSASSSSSLSKAIGDALSKPIDVNLSSRLVRSILSESGLLASHMLPLFTVVEVVHKHSRAPGTATPSASGTAFMTTNGKTDRVGLTRHLVEKIRRECGHADGGGSEDESRDIAALLASRCEEKAQSLAIAHNKTLLSKVPAIVKAIVSVWETTVGGGLKPRLSSQFAESGGDSLQAARFMGRLARTLVSERLMVLPNGDGGLAALEGGQLPKGLEAALLLRGIPSAAAGGPSSESNTSSSLTFAVPTLERLCTHIVSTVLKEYQSAEPLACEGEDHQNVGNSDEDEDDNANTDVSSKNKSAQKGLSMNTTSGRIAAMATATEANNPHAEVLLDCVHHGELFLVDLAVTSGLVSLCGRLDLRGATITALHAAAKRGDVVMCSLLMHHGARVTDVNAERSTPVFSAIEGNRVDVLDMFVRHIGGGGGGGATCVLQMRDGRAQGLLHAAARAAVADESPFNEHDTPRRAMVDYCLYNLKMDPETRDRWQRTPLHWAIINKNFPAIESILQFFEANGGRNINKTPPKFSNSKLALASTSDQGTPALPKSHWTRLATKGTSKPYQTPLELLEEIVAHAEGGEKVAKHFAERVASLPFV